MKKIYVLLFTILMTATSFGQDLLITGIIDGPLPGGDPKAIELYVINDIADLSTYGLEIAGNGGASTGEEYEFPADAYTAGDFIYVTNTGTSADFLQYFGFNPTYEDGVVSHNGDDTIILWSGDGSTIIDSIGEIGVDGTGTAWESLDGWAYRVDGMGPTTPFAVAEWTFSGINATDGCDLADDSGTNAGCGLPWPIGTYSPVASTIPEVNITAPGADAVLPAGTTSVDVEFTTANAPGSSQVDISIKKNGGSASVFSNITSPYTIMGTADGDSFEVTVTLDDSGPLDSETRLFSISFPCDLVIGAVTSTCDAVTGGTDTFTTTFDFTGGGTSTYALSTAAIGTIGGDDPSAMAAGTITVTGVDEAMDFSLTILGDNANSSCDITSFVNAPDCVPAVCAAVGSIIITEVMQNPSATGDPVGEYFEIYNTTGASIDLMGWVINDDADASTHTIASSLVVAPGAYAIIGNAGTTSPTLDYTYGTDLSLANGTDGLIIVCAATMIDTVIWDNGATFPDPAGASMELSTNNYDSISNDDGTLWCTAITDFGGGDLGTPGLVNDCAGLSVGRNEIDGFGVYPNPITDGYVTIRSASQLEKSVRVFDVLGKQVINTTINNNERVNVSNLNAGIYILKVEEEGKVATRKLIIQ